MERNIFEKQRDLNDRLNRYRDEYYNRNAPSVSDEVYDRLFDELKELEQETGIQMANSPTQTVGYPAVSRLEKTRHEVPLLSLDKTKSSMDLLNFMGEQQVMLMLKLDGLTVKLTYENGELLVPFRTWRNTITQGAADELTDVFQYNIPQRWSIAHLYQAILNQEPHVSKVRFITTLSGYLHWKLTGERVLGIGDAAGMFPIDSSIRDYHPKMLSQFDELIRENEYPWKIEEILPKVLCAGEKAGTLTEAGARLLDESGTLKGGIPMCPPEGDAGTGMTATNSVTVRTGNVSAGTSVFAMLVLENELKGVHREIDMVTTPAGDPVAMVHCNNCTSDLNAWVGLFAEFLETMGMDVDRNQLYGTLYRKAMEGEADGGGLLSYGYLSGEHITGFEEGRPMFVRTPDSRFNLANFMRVNLYTALGALKTGMDILKREEGVQSDRIMGHGGLFKTKGAGQQIMADAMESPVAVMESK